MALISVDHVCKEYIVHVQKPGIKNFFKNVFSPETKIITAVQDLSFQIEEGELVGFIGENGAGKSTTLKMITGILYPTSGSIHVANLEPYKNRKQTAEHIGVVFGQRSRLQWDLPIMDSFELYKEIYQIEDDPFKNNVSRFIEMLDMERYLQTPVRQLSLGQRMKAEISLSMLHNPDILFLDEPTIGLDVLAKHQIRDFIKERNRRFHVTTLLTSHDMKDLEEICDRLIILSHGTLIFDGSIVEFKKIFSRESVITVTCNAQICETIELLDPRYQIFIIDSHHLSIKYDPHKISVAEIISKLNQTYQITDLSISHPDIEDMVRTIFQTQKQENV